MLGPTGTHGTEGTEMFEITLINQTDGTVHGHKAGCADVKRGKKNADNPWTFSVSSKADARAEYNADFDEETEGWYDIEWLPCAKHVPATAPVEEPKVTAKVGSKWTYIYAADGSLIAEVRNDQAAAVLAYLS